MWHAGSPLLTLVLLSAAAHPPAATGATLADGQTIRLWPDVAPGSEGLTLSEEVIERSPEPARYRDRAATKILSPFLTVHHPPRPNGAALVVAPGGGYQLVVVDKEGEEIAEWLAPLGVTTFVLRYRLPADGHKNGTWVPLQDAQRAVRLVRSRAADWGLDPGRIGFMGFSAGGHLASSLAVYWDRRVYEPMDPVDAASARPDFVILGYPVIDLHTPLAHGGSRDRLLGKEPAAERVDEMSTHRQVSADTPRTFLMHAGNDVAVPVENSLELYAALRRAGVGAELHVFASGGHGYGIRGAKGPAAGWTTLCAEWLRSIEVLPMEVP